MTNQERIKEYLVGNKGYLKNNITNGKVIMLSGKWGSGKTHFWQNEIQTVLNDKEKKIPNHYISLYGKTSIQEIKSEIFLKVFESVDSFESEEKMKNIVKGSIDLVSSLTKTLSVFGMSLDLSKVTDKSFERIDNLLNDEKLKRTESYLNSGAIICFDDFERKSKDIDLNDLFGFITQLTLNFKCKVVIILNDDVFKGEEKDVFSRVKEKTVSKFLKYEPSIKELFDLIFEDNGSGKYFSLVPYKEIILKTIEEIEELNARIYFQVLDNLWEWVDKEQETIDAVLRCLILVNINFINNHIVFRYEIEKTDKVPDVFKSKDSSLEFIKMFRTNLSTPGDPLSNKHELYILDNLKKQLNNNNDKELVDKNQKLIWTLWNYEINLKYRQNVSDEIFQKINNFIETGILIND